MLAIKFFYFKYFNLFCFLLFIYFCIADQKLQCPYKNIYDTTSWSQYMENSCKPKSKICDQNNNYYSIDGSCNNINHSYWGETGTQFLRFLPANYSDGFYKFRTSVNGSSLPLARIIHTNILPIGSVLAKRENIFFYAFAQFVSHDGSAGQNIGFTAGANLTSAEKCCINNKPAPKISEKVCLPAIIPKNDSFFSKFGITCLLNTRYINTNTEGCSSKPIGQINFQTAYLDVSGIYGPSEKTSRMLRLFQGGLLNTSQGDFPTLIHGAKNCPFGGISSNNRNTCYLTGDTRSSQNPEFFSLFVIFTRLHNYIAKELQKINPKANDEQLFQEARRIVIAKYQYVTYFEHVPIILGNKIAKKYNLPPLVSGYADGYNSKMNAQTLDSYTAAASRSFHSMIKGKVSYLNSEGKNVTYLLRNKLLNLEFLTKPHQFTNIINAYTTEKCEKQDKFFTEEVSNYLFAVNSTSGHDLISIDINRGRDFGLQPYNKYREACNLCKLQSFKDFASEITNPKDVDKLEKIYKSIDDVDLYVGGTLEKPVPGGLFGPTFTCIQAQQFFRWKYGDRLYFEFPLAKFNLDQLQEIKTTTSMTEILCLTISSLTEFPRNGFLVESSQNPMISCDKIKKMNFSLWKY